MKLSDYIKMLNDMLEKSGDMECVVWSEDDDWDSSEEGWYSVADKEDVENQIQKHIGTACTYIANSGDKAYCSMNLKGYIDCQMEKVFIIKDVYE